MNFQEFLNRSESTRNVTKKVIVGDRFKDENGKDYAFTIKAISINKIEEFRRQATITNSKGLFEFSAGKFNSKLAIECCKYPNFKDAKSIEERGLHTPEEYLRDVLLPGEIEALGMAIQNACGYNVSVNELIETSKN